MPPSYSYSSGNASSITSLSSGIDGGIGSFSISSIYSRISVEGNFMSLLFMDDADSHLDLTGYDGCFRNLFCKVQSISGGISYNPNESIEFVAKNCLPATTLAPSCYDSMF